jgi:quinoprotein glucose dehydrogenase
MEISPKGPFPDIMTFWSGLIDAVAQPTKMGHLLVLDRMTGLPIFPITEESVPQRIVPGEKSSLTQPFPLVGLRYGQQRLTANEANNLSDSSQDFAIQKISKMISKNIFQAPGLEPTLTLPQFNGGTDWGGFI